MICRNMEAIRGELHEILESEKLLGKHPELRAVLISLEGGR